MPFVNVKIAGPAIAAEQFDSLHRGVTELMAGVLGKNADLTSVLVEEVPLQGWQVGARPLGCAAHIQAAVTAGTNRCRTEGPLHRGGQCPTASGAGGWVAAGDLRGGPGNRGRVLGL